MIKVTIIKVNRACSQTRSISFASHRDLAFTSLTKGMMEKNEMGGYQKGEPRSVLHKRFSKRTSSEESFVSESDYTGCAACLFLHATSKDSAKTLAKLNILNTYSK